jgi:23S rRNA pseudouridine2604 synthase
MCEYLTYEVTALKRVRIMNINLDMSSGTYRALTKEEFTTLNQLISDSIKTFEERPVNKTKPS